jgi:hypothetical protein
VWGYLSQIEVVEIGGGAKELVEKDSLLLKYKEGLLGTIDEL